MELPGKRTATSRTFLLPDGSFRTDVYTAPVNYTDADGVWRPIDNSLVPTDRTPFAVQNAANDYRMLVPADAGTTPVRVESGGAWVSFAAHGADGAPQVSGDEAAIRGGLGPNTMLEYQARNQGVKETIVLSAAPDSPPSYTFDLHTSPGLTPRSSGDGGLELADATGKPVFSVPAPFMTDSSGTDAGYSTNVTLDLAPAADGWTVTLTPDPAWLDDPARVYPVSIDPTVTVDLNPQTDTWIDENAPDVGHGGGDYVKAGWINGLRRRALLRFDLDNIGANVDVSSAKLRLYLDATQSTAGSATNYVARPVAEGADGTPWTKDATWNTYDGVAGHSWPNPRFVDTTDPGTSIAGTSSGVRNITVTQAVTGFINGTQPNNGLMLKQENDGVTTGTTMLLAFFSDNHTTTVEDEQPRLEITYTENNVAAFDKIGDRRFFTYEQQALNDRLNLKVNVANGNLLLSATDLNIAGTGLDTGVQRFYNSLSTSPDPAGLSAGWSLGDAPTVRLELNQPEPGRVVFVGPSGYRVRFDRNASGGYARAEPGLDAKLTLDDTAGEYTLEWFSKTKYIFDSGTGRMKRQEDKQGNTINYTYDANGNLDFLTDTQYNATTNNDRKIDFTYSGGLLESVTDVAGGRTYDYTYDVNDRLASSAVISYALGTDTVNVGPNVKTSYGYDGSGRVNLVTDPMGNRTKIAYVSSTDDRVASITRVGLVDETADEDPTTTFNYSSNTDCADPATAVVVDGPRRNVTDTTTYCHDTDDRIIKTVDAAGHERTTDYTTNSNVVSLNESGVAGAPAFGYTYSNADNLTKVTLPQTPGVTAPGTATAAYGDSTNPHFPTSVRDFATSKNGADPATWAYDYDDKGNLIEASHTGTPDIAFFYCYDGKGQLQRIDPPPQNISGPDENTTTGCGTANQGNDTLFTYFANGDLQKVDPPGTHGTQTFTYDAVSRIKTMTDGRGVITTYSYDALDHLTQLDFTGSLPGVAQVTYGYDPNGNMTARHDATGTSNFTFNDLNLMTKEDPQAPAATVTYTYDLARNVSTILSTKEPAPVTYAYNNLNLVNSVIDQNGRETTFGYNTKDQRTRTTYPHITGANSAIMKNVYDDAHRLVCTYTYSGTEPALGSDGCPTDRTAALIDVEYTYTDPATGLDTNTRFTSANQVDRTTTYDYDDIGRLTSATTKNTSNTVLRSYVYTLDKQANITKEVVDGTLLTPGTRTFAYNDANEMCWQAPGTPASDCATTPAGATTYSYDNAGNLATNSNSLSATYNLQGQTASVTPPGGQLFDMEYADVTSDRRVQAGSWRMDYNQLGLAAQADGSAGVPHTDWFVRDPNGTLISQIDDNSQNDNTLNRWYIFDGLGSVVGLVNNQGQLKKTYTYEPYGEEIGADPNDPNPWRYASGYYDKPTGMLKFGTRYYMPDIMRWTQKDPVAGSPANPMTLNPYAYVGADPIDATDLTGRDAWLDALGRISVVFAAGEILEELAAGDYAAAGGTLVGAVLGAAATDLCLGVFTIETFGTAAAGCLIGGAAAGEGLEMWSESIFDNF